MKCWRIIDSQDMFPEDEFTFSQVMEYANLWGETFKTWLNKNFKASDVFDMIGNDNSATTIIFLTEQYENIIRECHNKYGIEEVDCFCTDAPWDIPTRNACADEVDLYGEDLEEMCANCDLKCYGCEKIKTKTKDEPFEPYKNYILSKFTKKD